MILTDTGFWLALINPRDKYHQRAISVTENLDERLITTWPVITETCHLLGRHIGTQAQIAFMTVMDSGDVELAVISPQHIPCLTQLMQKYQDLPMDLADASLVLLAEELGNGRILSTDQRDFHTYRWKNHHPFQNLLTGE